MLDKRNTTKVAMTNKDNCKLQTKDVKRCSCAQVSEMKRYLKLKHWASHSHLLTSLFFFLPCIHGCPPSPPFFSSHILYSNHHYCPPLPPSSLPPIPSSVLFLPSSLCCSISLSSPFSSYSSLSSLHNLRNNNLNFISYTVTIVGR